MKNQINHPIHYNLPVPTESRASLLQFGFTDDEMNSVECIKAMEKALTPTVVYWFCVTNAIKYLWRAGNKTASPRNPIEQFLFNWFPLYRKYLRDLTEKLKEQDYNKGKWYLEYAESLDVQISEKVSGRVNLALKLIPNVKSL